MSLDTDTDEDTDMIKFKSATINSSYPVILCKNYEQDETEETNYNNYTETLYVDIAMTEYEGFCGYVPLYEINQNFINLVNNYIQYFKNYLPIEIVIKIMKYYIEN